MGVLNPRWKGGRIINDQGYVQLRLNNRYILEHRYLIEQKIGRLLTRLEEVHHINGIRNDNRLENLKLYFSMPEHMVNHRKPVMYPITGDGKKVCGKCHQLKELIDFSKEKAMATGYCIICRSCKNAKLRFWRHQNRERVLRDKRAYYHKRKELSNA